MDMIIGVPKEIKPQENRVALTHQVSELIRNGHKVLVEANAGIGSGFKDDEHKHGAEVITDAEVWSKQI